MKMKMKTFKTFALGSCVAAFLGAIAYAQDSQCEPVVAPCEPVQAVAEVQPCEPVAVIDETVEAKTAVPVYEPKPCEPVQVVEETVAPCEPVAKEIAAPTCVPECRPLPIRDIPYKHRVFYVVHKPRFDWECDCGRGLRRGVVPGKDGECRCWKCEHEIRVAEAKARREANADRRRVALERISANDFTFSYKSVVEIKREIK